MWWVWGTCLIFSDRSWVVNGGQKIRNLTVIDQVLHSEPVLQSSWVRALWACMGCIVHLHAPLGWCRSPKFVLGAWRCLFSLDSSNIHPFMLEAMGTTLKPLKNTPWPRKFLQVSASPSTLTVHFTLWPHSCLFWADPLGLPCWSLLILGLDSDCGISEETWDRFFHPTSHWAQTSPPEPHQLYFPTHSSRRNIR